MTTRPATILRPLLVLLLLAVAVAGLGTSRPAAAATDDPMAAYLDRSPASALALAVVDDGEVTVRGHGEDALGAAVDGSTPFRIASMSKSFTATLVMVLVEQGEVDLDAPLTATLPEFAMADERAGQITLRMLLAHTSGIGGGSTRDLGRPASVDPAVLLADLRDETLAADPGTEHVYSNTGYALAAAAVERATGRPFDQVLREELLAPLGMDATTALTGCADAVDGLGSGHTVVFGQVVPYPEPDDNCVGSGGMVSTAEDVATWLQFQAGDGGTPGGEPLLTTEGLRELHTPQPGTEGVDGFGLGWSFAQEQGVDLVEHGGALVTWTSHMAIVADEQGRPTGDAAVVLTDTVGTPGMLARALAAEAAGQQIEVPAQPLVRPATVFGAVIVLVLLLGAVGLHRSRSWPQRRRRVATRAAGLAWPTALAILCALTPALLARYAFGSPMGPVTSWHWGAGVLPEGLLLVALTGLVAVGLLGARLASLTRSRAA
ncbi:hypothetical protein BJF80_13970 [Serinicoccus sp. CUA-874]|uniref:serine hydrolase domain-containing protein n=1 Tax=Serinicoccus sp. CUA-874 TaxID=1517939 RepID=UPI0009661E27|nr:serine hydrolase domain-containing protein [Serinicoccus sp. CUA-874]OLT18945.1 hypothetical protein BJF80_13970 [Serinicoccus sp. CUA-874]